MDGNGRWAKRRFLARQAGHAAGAQNLRKISEQMNTDGFKILTVYAFSTENWKRSDDEVAYLMNLMRDYINQYIEDSKKNNIRINVIGDKSRLDTDLRESIEYLKRLTLNNNGMTLNLAINYGGRDEITRAAKHAATLAATGAINPESIDEKLISSYLDTAEFPDPDLHIRTGGDIRISNFMLWQFAYSELFYIKKFWPDFSYNDLLEIVADFQKRDRRFGS
jgi:undecaprenyl diphosphate synthase